MQPTVTPFFHRPTGTWTYVVSDPVAREAAVIDPVLDFDWRSGRTGTASADSSSHGTPVARSPPVRESQPCSTTPCGWMGCGAPGR